MLKSIGLLDNLVYHLKKSFQKKTKIQGLVRGLLTDYKKPSFLKIQSKLAELRNVKVCHNKKKKKISMYFRFPVIVVYPTDHDTMSSEA